MKPSPENFSPIDLPMHGEDPRVETEKPRDECGVFGIYSSDGESARRSFFGLYALQHRGQESAGIASFDGSELRDFRGMGLVDRVFYEDEKIRDLPGQLAIGHVRYSTAGSKTLRNAQPAVTKACELGPIALAHNGNLTNVRTELVPLLEELNVDLNDVFEPDAHFAIDGEDQHVSDSRVATAIIWAAPGKDWRDKLRFFMERAKGGYSMTMLTPEGIYAFRDPKGMRPLAIGEREDNGHKIYAVASETCALLTVNATHDRREVRNGEVLLLNERGIRPVLEMPDQRPQFCMFENVYIARPDSERNGEQNAEKRWRIGWWLGEQAPVDDADLVIGVPESGLFAAAGYAHRLGKEYRQGFAKNQYVHRTFIEPTQDLRAEAVRLKLNAYNTVKGKKVVLIDDSLVRGTTAPQIVERLRSVGALEVHLRIASPPLTHPCHWGVDMPTYEELIANNMDLEELERHIGADSIVYLTLDNLYRATREHPDTVCTRCFDGELPEELLDDDPGSGC